MTRNKVIFISGEIASGKSTFTEALREMGYRTVDTDAIAREVVEPGTKGLELLATHFPQSVKDGVLDRSLLAEAVFKDEEKREHLNALLHPLIMQRLDEITGRTNQRIFVEVPLIHHAQVRESADLIIYLKVSKKRQLHWLMERNQLSYEEALARVDSFEKQDHHAQVVILNNGDEKSLKDQARSLVKHIK